MTLFPVGLDRGTTVNPNQIDPVAVAITTAVSARIIPLSRPADRTPTSWPAQMGPALVSRPLEFHRLPRGSIAPLVRELKIERPGTATHWTRRWIVFTMSAMHPNNQYQKKS